MNISGCPDSWDYVHSQRGLMCYKVVGDKRITWGEARTDCEEENGDLASIKYQEEYVSFCAKIRTGSRDSVNALTYLWHTMGLS